MTTSLPENLARVLRARPAAAPGEHCDMCSEALDDNHAHVVDLTNRTILCCCRACGMLFTDARAARGRYRTIPDRWLHDPDLVVTKADWERLQIPVRVVFFFLNSTLRRVVALYPGPGGATESELALAAWEDVLAATPLGQALTPDVEALLVDRGETHPSCHLVPIDACYELVGRLRLRWVGFDGGQEAREEFARFFAMVQQRSRPLTGPG